MIIQTGMRTDIPAFYSEWLVNRIKEGYVLVRNPYNPVQVTKYRLSPEVVDLMAFCTKNPEPMLKYMDILRPYGQYWFVTITPYGKDIEPNVPDKNKVMEDFKRLSDIVGVDSVGWRYDPILTDRIHTAQWHIAEFEKMASCLSGYTKTCVISFLDIYKKVERNFPEARTVTKKDRLWSGLLRLHDGRYFRNGTAYTSEYSETENKSEERILRLLYGSGYWGIRYLRSFVPVLLCEC